MVRHHQPRKGSVAYSPRKRVAKETPRVKSWPQNDEPKLLGLAGYIISSPCPISAKTFRSSGESTGEMPLSNPSAGSIANAETTKAAHWEIPFMSFSFLCAKSQRICKHDSKTDDRLDETCPESHGRKLEICVPFGREHRHELRPETVSIPNDRSHPWR